jgi:spermidine/putrescine transport system substrate-binding protein
LAATAVLAVVMLILAAVSLAGCKAAVSETAAASETVAIQASEAETQAESASVETEAAQKTFADIEKNFGGKINGLFLSGYGEADAFKAFTEKYNVEVVANYFGTFDEAFTKIKTSPAGTFDVVSLNCAFVKQFADAGLLESLDLNLIPNWTGMYQHFQNVNFQVEGESRYTVPFTWGTAPLHYNTEYMEMPDSWMILTDPALKNKVGIVDDYISEIQVAAIATGHKGDVNKLTQEDLDKAIDFLRKVLANSDKIAASYGDLITMYLAEDIWTTTVGWEYFSIASQNEGIPLELTVPSEGSFSWIDSLAVVKDAPNIDTAYGLVNQNISKDAQVFWGNFLATGVVNPDAVEGVDPSLTKYFPYDRLDDYLSTMPLGYMPPTESDEFTTQQQWIDAWNSLKME